MVPPLDNTPAENPLLAELSLPYGALPLDQLKPDSFLPAFKAAIAAAEKEVEAIKNNPAAPSFKNTIEALEFSGVQLGRVNSMFDLITGAKNNDELRAIEDEVTERLTRHGNSIMMDDILFARIQAVYDVRENLKLTTEQKTLLEKTYESFVRSGALLDDDDKQEMREISEKLSKLSTAYSNNNVKSTEEFQKVIDNESDLAGVPERARNSYKAAAEEAGQPGKWLIKLSPPPVDILDYCENRKLREEIYNANTNISGSGKFDNHQTVLEIVRLRHRQAEIMGYPNFAAYKLSDKMAKDPETVMNLLNRNVSVYKTAAEKFLKQVQDYAEKTDGIKDLKPWDFSYYSRKLKEETFKLDLEQVRPYFNLENVLEGVRHHAEKLFNITLTETKGKYPVYDPDVKVYEVKDNKSGDMIGIFYADYYARPGAKNSGAWMSTLRERGLEDGVNKFAIAYNICNFPKPTKDQPALLSLDEVRTTFHEFGHALHALLALGSYTSINGANVKWDYVEAPSQIQENWVRQKEVLDTFARHYKTNQSIPAELVKKISDMENFDAAYMGLRQTFFGLLDMKWHTTDPKTITSVEALEDSIVAQASLFARQGAPMSVKFGHLFAGGYAAGYYGYKWAEALEADMFTPFAKNGPYDQTAAGKLRTLLSKGGTEDPEKLVEDYLGRKPDPDALFRREGLLPPDDKQRSKAAPAPKPKL